MGPEFFWHSLPHLILKRPGRGDVPIMFIQLSQLLTFKLTHLGQLHGFGFYIFHSLF